jgi:RNA polymerase-binding transcription factor DksA
LSTIDTSEFRKLLEAERTRLQHASGRLEADELSDDGELAGGVDNHLGDAASDTYDRELEEGLDDGVRETLRQIDGALARIDEGTYGLCEIDNKPIPEERLRAIPWTARCIEHAQ